MQNENLRKVENKKPNIMEEILYYEKVNRCLKDTFGLVVLLDLSNYNLGRGIMIAHTSLFFFFFFFKKDALRALV